MIEDYKKYMEELAIPIREYKIIYYNNSGDNIFEVIFPSPYPPGESLIKNIALSEALIYSKYEIL